MYYVVYIRNMAAMNGAELGFLGEMDNSSYSDILGMNGSITTTTLSPKWSPAPRDEDDPTELIKLSGLLFIVGVLFILFIYCLCNSRRQEVADRAAAAAIEAAAVDQEANKAAAVAKDLPPTYSTLVLKPKEPPGYLTSVLNEELNPQLNPDWSWQMARGELSPEVAEVVRRARSNSVGAALDTLGGDEADGGGGDGELSREEPRRHTMPASSSAAVRAAARARARARARTRVGVTPLHPPGTFMMPLGL